MPTRDARLHAVLARVAPRTMAHYARTGQWLNQHPDPGQKRDPVTAAPLFEADGTTPIPARHSGAPYLITTKGDGSRKVQVFGEDGDIIGATAPTLDEAIAQLELKLRIAEEVTNA